jgi:hypothetical protein
MSLLHYVWQNWNLNIPKGMKSKYCKWFCLSSDECFEMDPTLACKLRVAFKDGEVIETW